MVAGRDVDGKRAVEVESRAVFEDEPRGRWNIDPLAGAPHDDRRGRRRVALGAHRAAQRLTGRR